MDAENEMYENIAEDHVRDIRVSQPQTHQKRALNNEKAVELPQPLAKKTKREGGMEGDFYSEEYLPVYKFTCEVCEIALQCKETLFMHMLKDHFEVEVSDKDE